jgi:DHA1 family multidrug resistance protein-like MFS transporter
MDSLDVDLEAAETEASTQISRRATSDSSIQSLTMAHTHDIARLATQIENSRSAHLQHVYTVGSTRTEARESKPLPGFGAGKPYPPVIPAEREAYVVDFEGPEDPLHPMNWTSKKK